MKTCTNSNTTYLVITFCFLHLLSPKEIRLNFNFLGDMGNIINRERGQECAHPLFLPTVMCSWKSSESLSISSILSKLDCPSESLSELFYFTKYTILNPTSTWRVRIFSYIGICLFLICNRQHINGVLNSECSEYTVKSNLLYFSPLVPLYRRNHCHQVTGYIVSSFFSIL